MPLDEVWSRIIKNAVVWAFVFYTAFNIYKAMFKNYLRLELMMKIKVVKPDQISQKLSDVKGIDEIKEELQNVIKMLNNPWKYRNKGCKLHKGIMLFGEPGTGKTMIARAIAGEAGCNFIHCTGSDFDEIFVGVGSLRIRQLFKEARKQQPCIIFIDEIDGLLSESRRNGGEHSDSRSTINQFLSEMDGFTKNDNIVVIGATNHEKSLDHAATRPGRFDKKIHIPRPDINGRVAIFQHYLDNIVKSDDVNA